MITNDAVTDFRVILDIWGPAENKGVFYLGSEDSLILSIEVRRKLQDSPKEKFTEMIHKSSVNTMQIISSSSCIFCMKERFRPFPRGSGPIMDSDGS